MASSSDDDDNQVELWSREETPLLEIDIGNSAVLRLRQYGSHDDRWGIHSCVWDGGLALLLYFSQCYAQDNSQRSVVLDLGAGTGIVGLGMTNYGASQVILTDLPDAIPLLEENVELNPFTNVAVHELTWGELELPQSIETILSRSASEKLMVVGADIVYRQNLFEPLLSTLDTLWKCRNDAEFWFGSQSTRRYLHEFWNLAKCKGWTILHHTNIHVAGNSCELSTVPETRDGIVNIFQLIRYGASSKSHLR
jgi:predicted nicotinamide N-methyase